MEFGLIAAAALPGRDSMPSQDAFDFAMRCCEAAHASGYDALSLSHRFLAGPGHQFLQPLVTAARLLTLYPDMYVATGILLLPYYNPVDIAEQVATLDMMAPGRLLLGVGQGYRRDEATAFGIAGRSRGAMMTESIAALRRLWRDTPASFDGKFWSFDGADIGIRPRNGYGPPIMIAADEVASVERIPSRGGDHWLPSVRQTRTFLREAMPRYRAAMEAAGKPFKGVPLMRDICIADSESEAEQLVATSFGEYLQFQGTLGQPGEKYEGGFEELKQDRLIAGTPEQAAADLIALHAEFDAEFVLLRVYTPGMDPDAALEVVNRVGHEVLPLVRAEVGTSSLFGSRRPDEEPLHA